MAKKNIKFNKYNSKENYINAIGNSSVDESTFSVVRTRNCNSNENNNNSGDVKDLYISDTKLTDVYNSRKVDSGNTLETNVSVGGIPAGTKLSELTQMPLGEILDKIFFKTYKPVVKNNVSVNVNYSGADYLVGSTFPLLTNSNITVDCGIFKLEQPDGTFVDTTPLSAGLESYQVEYTPSNRVMSASGATIKVNVTLQAGDAPKDSSNEDVESLRYNGGVIQKTITLYPYYDWYATTCSGSNYGVINNISTQSGKRYMGCKKVTGVVANICGGDATHPQTIKVPGQIKNCKVEIQGNFVDYSFDNEWDLKTTEDVNGKIYSVYEYKSEHYKDGSAGGFKLKFDVE